MSKRNLRKKRFDNSPQWVIALLSGAVAVVVAASICIVGLHMQMANALIIGVVVGALVAAPTAASEAVAGIFAVMLELIAQAAVLVIMLPLLMIGSCGV